ncbi:hypothetical protein ACSFCT_09485 [Yokenella regensburgei]
MEVVVATGSAHPGFANNGKDEWTGNEAMNFNAGLKKNLKVSIIRWV